GLDWMFEAVFDYGEHSVERPQVTEERAWPVRADPFSNRRATFDVRTYRLCRRVLMFHRFAELGPEPAVVRSLDFEYDETPAVTYLKSATLRGWSATTSQAMPPLEFEYGRPVLDAEVHAVDAASSPPGGVDGRAYRWVDLDGEGIAGAL